MKTLTTITIDNETITPAECEALWLDWRDLERTDDMAEKRGCDINHMSALIFAGEKIWKGETA